LIPVQYFTSWGVRKSCALFVPRSWCDGKKSLAQAPGSVLVQLPGFCLLRPLGAFDRLFHLP